jgi:hypothetical protein
MGFPEATIQRVWEKGRVVPNNDPRFWRKDECGAWISISQYGNRGSQYGWEIDHIRPVANGGNDDLSNLRPLQWENNAAKQDGRLVCAITAADQDNVRKAGNPLRAPTTLADLLRR